jgi:exodeoxyribonuclease VII small subunit
LFTYVTANRRVVTIGGLRLSIPFSETKEFVFDDRSDCNESTSGQNVIDDNNTDDVATISFEDSFAKVEQIVRKLEQGTMGLDDSLAAYQQAVIHLRSCQAKLAEANRKVELLQEVALDGTYTSMPVDDEATSLEVKATARSTRRSATKKNTSRTDDLF